MDVIQTEFNFDDSPNKIENFDAKKDAIKVELTCQFPPFQFIQQLLPIGIKHFPSPFPCCPAPTASPLNKECIRKSWVFCEITCLNMADTLFILIYLQSIIHKLKEIG